jgi:hypothetical protein
MSSAATPATMRQTADPADSVVGVAIQTKDHEIPRFIVRSVWDWMDHGAGLVMDNPILSRPRL